MLSTISSIHSSRTYESTACDSNTNSINAGRSSVESAERLRFSTCHKSSRKIAAFNASNSLGSNELSP